jgi:hypothetical protein
VHVCVCLQVVCDLVRKALTAPLLPSQQQLVLAHLDADPQLVHTLQLQPQQLPALVENTPMLAYQLLVRMQGSRRITSFYQVGQGRCSLLNLVANARVYIPFVHKSARD